MNIQVHTWIYGTLEFTYGTTNPNSLANGMRIRSLALEYTHGLMEECKKENGKTTSSMVSYSCANEYSFLWV